VWFKDYVRCNYVPEAEHANILLSDTNSLDGGTAEIGGNFGHSQTGRYVSYLPTSYEAWGYGDPYDAMHTVMEELAHNLQESVRNLDDDNNVYHDSGALYYHSQGYTISPLGIDGREDSGGTNNCDDSYSTAIGVDGWEMHWSDCCIKDWKSA
jgi:hypothetical protein